MSADGDNIFGRHVDIEVIKQFQKLDGRYSIEKFRKLENRFIAPHFVVGTTVKKTPKTIRKIETKTYVE